MGLYEKQALFSFNIFLILPAILGVLASMLVYNEQRCDVLKQLWIIPVSKGGYLFAKWVVVLTVSLAFMMLAVGFTFAFGLAFGFLSWNGEMMAFILYKGIKAAVLEAVAVIPILALAVSHKRYLLPCCAAIIYAFLGFIVAQTNPLPDSLCLCHPWHSESAEHNNARRHFLSSRFCHTHLEDGRWLLESTPIMDLPEK